MAIGANYFGFNGRIGRLTFFKRSIILGIVSIIWVIFGAGIAGLSMAGSDPADAHRTGIMLGVLLMIPVIWSSWAS